MVTVRDPPCRAPRLVPSQISHMCVYSARPTPHVVHRSVSHLSPLRTQRVLPCAAPLSHPSPVRAQPFVPYAAPPPPSQSSPMPAARLVLWPRAQPVLPYATPFQHLSRAHCTVLLAFWPHTPPGFPRCSASARSYLKIYPCPRGFLHRHLQARRGNGPRTTTLPAPSSTLTTSGPPPSFSLLPWRPMAKRVTPLLPSTQHPCWFSS